MALSLVAAALLWRELNKAHRYRIEDFKNQITAKDARIKDLEERLDKQ